MVYCYSYGSGRSNFSFHGFSISYTFLTIVRSVISDSSLRMDFCMHRNKKFWVIYIQRLVFPSVNWRSLLYVIQVLLYTFHMLFKFFYIHFTCYSRSFVCILYVIQVLLIYFICYSSSFVHILYVIQVLLYIFYMLFKLFYIYFICYSSFFIDIVYAIQDLSCLNV